METFTELKKIVKNPSFREQRRKSLRCLTDDMLDTPIIAVVNGFNKLSYSFTLQSCYGHFIYHGQTDPRNLDSLPEKDPDGKVTYKIAYIAFCIENNLLAMALFEDLKAIPAIDPDYVQLCCADWFWDRQVNAYALQVEPDRFKRQDTAILDFEEALHVERVRNEFFSKLYRLLEKAKTRQ